MLLARTRKRRYKIKAYSALFHLTLATMMLGKTT
jgi:hypothetical protein